MQKNREIQPEMQPLVAARGSDNVAVSTGQRRPTVIGAGPVGHVPHQLWFLYKNMYNIPTPLPSLKPLKFVGSSLDAVRAFPKDVKHALGIELMRVQAGVEPADFKPMKTVGVGVYEIRVQLLGAWRVIYVARFAGIVYILHAFQKKTRKTARCDIQLAAARYKSIRSLHHDATS